MKNPIGFFREGLIFFLSLSHLIGIILLIGIYSCERIPQQIQTQNLSKWSPVGIAYNINFIYTDSARVEAILKAPVHVDYSNLDFEYSEFPKGLEITFFDLQGNESYVYANYGLIYNRMRIADLQKGVRLLSHDGAQLTTQQLYWDSKNKWLFTEESFNFKNQDYEFNGQRLDADRDFSNYQSGQLMGSLFIQEDTPNDSLLTDE
ncbi:MAG: LPS export ABC transporter periplasmic protein LptC [Flavobacteriaceae bacterium]|nr:LPS export ABC transporter periplasmic protein LptC [Flavobacteriaceae bacterium]MCY4267833.1 LPS export ABC transporter periplasmic protein LptC [Flavobacteriaceae bacterium]MCY4299529.1 LPS export ABC transporter periplasmic protein LptC [Flavobacteriaceae bacterium]